MSENHLYSQTEIDVVETSACRSLWSEVIHLMLWDYAHMRREYLSRKMSVTRENKYRRIRYSVFGRRGSLVEIAATLGVDTGGLVDGARKAVSDEQIATGHVLGKKMREDDPNVKPRSLAERERREGE